MKKKKPEICQECGQVIKPDVFTKHLIKKLKDNGLPSMARFFTMITKQLPKDF